MRGGNRSRTDLFSLKTRKTFGTAYAGESTALRANKKPTDSDEIRDSIKHLDKPMCPGWCMGVDNQTTMPHATAIFDAYFEAGGNTFDTAHIYGGGKCE